MFQNILIRNTILCICLIKSIHDEDNNNKVVVVVVGGGGDDKERSDEDNDKFLISQNLSHSQYAIKHS